MLVRSYLIDIKSYIMSSSTHHIQSVRYNRSLQVTPKNRVSRTFNIIEKAIKKRTSYGTRIVDHKSSVDRAYIRGKMNKARARDAVNSLIAVVVFSALIIGFLYTLGLL